MKTTPLFDNNQRHVQFASHPQEVPREPRNLYQAVKLRKDSSLINIEFMNHLNTLKVQLLIHKKRLENNPAHQVAQELSFELLDDSKKREVYISTKKDAEAKEQHVCDVLFGSLEDSEKLLNEIEKVTNLKSEEYKHIQKVIDCPQFKKMLERAQDAGADLINMCFFHTDIYCRILEKLIIAGLNIDKIFDAGAEEETFLRLASLNKETQTTKLLLEYGADPNSTSKAEIQEGSALLYALFDNSICSSDVVDPEMVNLLLDAGADIEESSKCGEFYGQTPISMACQLKHSGIVKRLIEMGAKIDVQSWGNKTPLMLAIESGQFDNAEILLNAGANILLKDTWDKTAKDYLYEYRDQDHDEKHKQMAKMFQVLLNQKSHEQQKRKLKI